MDMHEVRKKGVNGWPVAALLVVALGLLIVYFYHLATSGPVRITPLIAGVVAAVLWAIAAAGFFTLEPNVSAVLMLFGRYMGTVTESGLRWANPLYSKTRISLRARNINGTPIKVNDLRGNPIEIAAVVVWRVANTAQAMFDVERYEQYVTIQTESALRHLTMAYPYDTFEGDTLSLRGSTDEVSASLKREIQERVGKAGVAIEEARLSHLAYAPEIAGAMLQRQQAEAVVAARTRIVDGAVGIVEMALKRLEQSSALELDAERKAAMVGNLMVVLCGHEAPRPVINTGTLYT